MFLENAALRFRASFDFGVPRVAFRVQHGFVTAQWPKTRERCPSLTSGDEHVMDRVDHLLKIGLARSPLLAGRRKARFGQRPFLVRQITSEPSPRALLDAY